jgi:hypothetical protein
MERTEEIDFIARVMFSSRKERAMRLLSTPTIAVVAAIALSASAADARSRHTNNFGDAHAANGSGHSTPHNADGPAYGDFQLQGR